MTELTMVKLTAAAPATAESAMNASVDAESAPTRLASAASGEPAAGVCAGPTYTVPFRFDDMTSAAVPVATAVAAKTPVATQAESTAPCGNRKPEESFGLVCTDESPKERSTSTVSAALTVTVCSRRRVSFVDVKVLGPGLTASF